jgi:signal transduction histidine kinase
VPLGASSLVERVGRLVTRLGVLHRRIGGWGVLSTIGWVAAVLAAAAPVEVVSARLAEGLDGRADAVVGAMAAALLLALSLAGYLACRLTRLRRSHAEARLELRDALARTAVATSRSQASDHRRAELRHDARAALLGVEAAARALARQRDLLTPAERDELTSALVAEVHRLGALLDDQTAGPASFDLRDAITPILACARADGLDLTVDVPPGIEVAGSREDTGRALLSLLDNARVHAPGSAVGVRSAIVAPDAVLCVEDRGPGVPAAMREEVFERSVRVGPGAGSGLGLYVARRLVEASGGSLAHEPRPNGGSTFVMRLRLAASASGADPGQPDGRATGSTGARGAHEDFAVVP